MSRGLRVEERTVIVAASTPVAPDEWRTRAIQTGQRLSDAEGQLKDLRKVTEDLRARERKAKERLDSSQARVNDLQAENVKLAAEVEDLKAQLKPLADLRQTVWTVLEDAQQTLLEKTT